MVVMCVTVSTIMIMMICNVSVIGKVSQYHLLYPGVVNMLLKNYNSLLSLDICVTYVY